MKNTVTGKQVVKQWFDQLERQLHEDARLAGLLQHGTMMGNAREFFIRRVLRSFLPPSVTIGTGKVLGANSCPSKQIDVVVYDSRFPVLQMPDGQALFLTEGVIGAIEVKSQLDGRRLTEALDNCLSVAQISPGLLTEDYNAELAKLERSLGSNQRAQAELVWKQQTRTYIFGFRGSHKPRTLNDRIRTWLIGKQGHFFAPRLLVPSVIVSGGSVAIREDDPIQITGGEVYDANGNPADDVDGYKLMTTWASKKRFGWLATHLLHEIERRSLQNLPIVGVRRGISQYYPFEDYYNEYGAEQEKIVLVLQPPEASDPSCGVAESV